MKKRKTKQPKFRSGFEKEIANQLSRLGFGFSYEEEQLAYTLSCSYLVDFLVEDLGFYLEVKGYFPAKDRRKMLAVKRDNPEKDIRFVFMRDNYLTKSKKMKYSDWCEKHGFKYCFERIPKTWLKK